MWRVPSRLVLLWMAVLALFPGPTSSAGDFIAGADASHLKFFEDRGVAYREGGIAGDALEILKRRGLNCVRLRLFTSHEAQAQASPYNFINNLDYTLPLAIRVKQAGLRLLLDFHYSDTWADPGKQAKPSAWTNLVFADLESAMTEYSRHCVARFKAAGALPDYVQVGNEITSGMLWPDGRVGGAYETAAQWSQLGRLLKAAVRGVREAAGTEPPGIIVHIDRGGDWAATQWYFDRLRQQQVEFDLIGLSYYPFWHGNLDALRRCLHQAAERYGKPLIIAETAFPWTNSTDVAGLPASPDGQKRYVVELAKMLQSVPRGLGRGIFWWGTEYQGVKGVPTAGFEYRSLFDAGGNVLPASEALGQLTAPVRIKAELSGTSLVLSWPLSGAGLQLAYASSVSPESPWQLQVSAPVSSGLMTTTLLPMGKEPARFFRLQTPDTHF